MKLTVKYLNNQFYKYNNEFFGGILPDIDIVINRTKNCFGAYHYVRSDKYNPEKPIKITISKYYDRSEHDVCTTLIHEMIHYYISFMGMKDNNKHGVLFHNMCDEINKISNGKFKVTKCSSSVGLELTNKSNKRYKIMLFNYHNRTCYARISENFDYNWFVKKYKLENVSIFYSTNKNFDRWTCCRNRLKFYYDNMINFNIKRVA